MFLYNSLYLVLYNIPGILPTFNGAKITIIFEIPTFRYNFFFYLYSIEIKAKTISSHIIRL